MSYETLLLHENVETEKDNEITYDILLRVPSHTGRQAKSFCNSKVEIQIVTSGGSVETKRSFPLYKSTGLDGRSKNDWKEVGLDDIDTKDKLRSHILANKSKYKVGVQNIGRIYNSVLDNKNLSPKRENIMNKKETI